MSIAALGWKEVHSPDSSQWLKEMSGGSALEKKLMDTVGGKSEEAEMTCGVDAWK